MAEQPTVDAVTEKQTRHETSVVVADPAERVGPEKIKGKAPEPVAELRQERVGPEKVRVTTSREQTS